MALEEKDSILFTITKYVFEALTFGWVAEFLIFISVFLALGSLLFIFKNLGITLFIIKDRIRFMKYYIYNFFKEKTIFLKSFIYVLKNELDYTKIIFIGIGLIVVAIGITFIIIKISSLNN